MRTVPTKLVPADLDAYENGVQQVYYEIKDSLRLILGAELAELLPRSFDLELDRVLNSLDDAISNNWDDLMESFWMASETGDLRVDNQGDVE